MLVFISLLVGVGGFNLSLLCFCEVVLLFMIWNVWVWVELDCVLFGLLFVLV